MKKTEKVSVGAKAAMIAEAREQLERYVKDNGLAKEWRLRPNGTVTLIRLVLVFHGEELFFAEEIPTAASTTVTSRPATKTQRTPRPRTKEIPPLK